MSTDQIADFITRIKNAGQAGQRSFAVPRTKMVRAIADVLAGEGYIGAIEEKEINRQPHLVVEVQYDERGRPTIQGAKRVSKPSRRFYQRAQDIRSVRQGYGAVFVTTPQGVMTGAQAREANVGGEVLFEIW